MIQAFKNAVRNNQTPYTMDLYNRARTLFSQVNRDVEHAGHHGTEHGYLSIRDGYEKFHYSKEDWMIEEIDPEELHSLLDRLSRMDRYWYRQAQLQEGQK